MARLRTAASVLLGLALGCAVSAAAPPDSARVPRAPARTPTAKQALERARGQYRAHLLAARPDLATRFGLPHAERRLVPLTQATIESDGAWLAALARRLDSLDAAALPARARAELDSLRAHVARERAPYERAAWTSDPDVYLALVPGAILDVALAPHVSPCERAHRAAGRLAGVPEVLRAAQINLGERPGGDGTEGARGAGTAADGRAFDRARTLSLWGSALDSLSIALPAHVAGCAEPERQADLIAADTLACAAVRRFIRFLAEEFAPPGTLRSAAP